MNIAIGCDHGGYEHKKIIKSWLLEQGYHVTDFGTYSNDSIDYTDIALSLSESVALGENDRGILICGTGIGMSVSANKVQGIRAALVHDTFTAKATREHNDSNVLAMGGRVISLEKALEIVSIWISTEFSHEERHHRRIQKISDYEERNNE
jgi:ribose 5-phosphate isomerase B